MEYTIEQLKNKIFQEVYNVYEVFKNHFGEEFVDLQGIPSDIDFVDAIYACTDIGTIETEFPFEISDADFEVLQTRYRSKYDIIVHWPRVTITNEHYKSIIIQDLFAKTQVSLDGKIPYENLGFMLTRSTYNSIQFQSGYKHSHTPGFYAGTANTRDITRWDHPCLGTGPIRNTIAELKNNNDEVSWMLYCEELDRYVTVESLTGGPYRKLEEIGSADVLREYTDYSEVDSNLSSFYYFIGEEADFYEWLKSFILYYLQHGHLCFNYQNEAFKPGMSHFNFMIDISNTFIEWFNQTGNESQVQSLFHNNVLVNSFVADGKFYKNREATRTDASIHEGAEVLTFKGHPVTLHIELCEETELETTILLNHKIAMYILQNVLKIINYRYKNEHNNQQGADNKATAPTYQTVVYL